MSLEELQLKEAELKATLQAVVLEEGDIGPAAQAYAEAVAALQKEKVAQSAGAINTSKVELASQIQALVGASPLEGLIGEKVTALGWQLVTSDEGATSPKVSINPKRVKATAKSSNGGGGRRSTFKVTAEGVEYTNAAAYVELFANDEERKHSHFAKWPTKLGTETIAKRLGHTVG